MKMKISKKAICLVLSALLVFTSLPFVALADEAKDTTASYLSTAIGNYEAKMNGTVFTNMLGAYNKYCAAIKLYDQYSYTNAKFDGSVTAETLTQAAKDLNDASDKMERWEAGKYAYVENELEQLREIPEVAATQEVPYDDGSWQGPSLPLNENAYYDNILYTEQLPDSATGSVSVGGANVTIRHGNAVVFYNGEEDQAVVPVAVKTDGANLYSVYPNSGSDSRRNSNDIALGYKKGRSLPDVDSILGDNNYWIGVDASNSDFIWNFTQFIWYPDNRGGRKYVSADYETGLKIVTPSDRFQTSGHSVFNGMKVKSLTDDQYSKVITPTWYVVAGNNSTEGFMNNDTASIYVINYNALCNAISSYASKLDIGIVDTYANGGLKSVIEAFDNAIKLNISGFDYASNISSAVEAAANKIKSTVEELKTVEKSADPSAYQSLRDAIDAQRARYEMYNTKDSDIETQKPEDVFGAEQWGRFKTLYEEALGYMEQAVSENYPASGDTFDKAQDKAVELNTFVLEPTIEKVDTIILEYAIDNADFVIQNASFFAVDEAKLASIESAVKAAKIAIWQKEENYPIDEYEPSGTPDNEDLVFEHLGYVADSIRNISVNFNAKTKYAHDTSLNEVVAEAKDILDNHRAEYANSGELQIVYDNAVNYMSTENNLNLLSEPGRQNYARDLYNTYRDTILNLHNVIHNLQSTFTTNIENGEIISEGNEATSVNISQNVDGKGPTYSLNDFARHTNQVFFRTNNNEADFNLGAISMSINNNVSGDKNRNILNGLDALNLDTTVREATFLRDDRPSISFTGNARQYTSILTETPKIMPISYGVSDVQNSDYAASLSASVTANDGTTAQYKITEIYATDGNSSNMSNRLATGANGEAINNPEQNLADLVGKTDGHDGYGLINAYNNVPTHLMSNFLLHVPKVSNSVPTQTTYSFTDKYLGMVWHYRNQYSAAIWDGYNVASAQYAQSATVVDITPLITLTKQAEEKLAEYKDGQPVLYTTDSANALASALAGVESEFNYWEMNATQITALMTERYNAVKTALDGLEKRADFENGYKDTATNETISSYSDAKYAVFKLLEDPTKHFTAKSIEALQKQLSEFKYLNCTAEEMENIGTKNGEQTEINNEIKNLLKVVSDFENGEESAVLKEVSFEAYEEAAREVPSLNTDAYDKAAVQKIVDETTIGESTKINDQPVMCYDQDKVDEGATNILESINTHQHAYTVDVTDSDGNKWIVTDKNGTLAPAAGAVGYIFHYGDIVTVKNPEGAEACDWSETIIAKTTQKEQVEHYMATDASYSFNIRGTTHLFTNDASSSAGDTVKITFLGRNALLPLAFDRTSKSEAYDLVNAPTPVRMYYTVENYTDVESGKVYTDSIPADVLQAAEEDGIKLYVSYKLSKESDEYQITVKNWNNDSNYSTQSAKYGRYVTIEHPDPSEANRMYGFMDTKSGRILGYGTKYKFSACQNLDIKPIVSRTKDTLYSDPDKDENYDVSVISEPILANDKALFVGSYSYADSDLNKCTVVGAGVVLNASGEASETLTLGDVDGANKILNLSVPVSAIDPVSKQFAVSMGYANLKTRPYPISYVSYVIYEKENDDGNIKRHTVYSNVVSDAELN